MNHKIFWFRKINVWIRTTNECAINFSQATCHTKQQMTMHLMREIWRKTDTHWNILNPHTHTLPVLLKATASTFYYFSKHEKKTSATFLLFLGKKLNNENFVSLRSGLDTFFRNIKNRNLLVLCLWFTCLNCILFGTKSQQRNALRYTCESIKETNESCCENSCQLCTQFPRKITKIQ